MGFSKHQQKENIIHNALSSGFNQLRNNRNKSKILKINGLVFDNEENFNILKKYDKHINEIVKLVKKNIIDINDVFKSLDKIYVEETYYGAYDEVDELFKNTTSLLIYEDTPYNIEYKIACKFFDNIEVIKYDE